MFIPTPVGVFSQRPSFKNLLLLAKNAALPMLPLSLFPKHFGVSELGILQVKFCEFTVSP